MTTRLAALLPAPALPASSQARVVVPSPPLSVPAPGSTW